MVATAFRRDGDGSRTRGAAGPAAAEVLVADRGDDFDRYRRGARVAGASA
jgi:hypothetical protein